jgi:hypothetical protein
MTSSSLRIPNEVSWEVSVVQLPTKGPLLCHVVLSRVHSLTHTFPTKQIRGESTLPAPLIDTPRLASITYYIKPYPYRLMVVLFSWVVTSWTGPYIWVWWLTTNFRNPPDIVLNYHHLLNTVSNRSPQIPIFLTTRELTTITGWQQV